MTPEQIERTLLILAKQNDVLERLVMFYLVEMMKGKIVGLTYEQSLECIQEILDDWSFDLTSRIGF